MEGELIDQVKSLLNSRGYELDELLGVGGFAGCYKVVRIHGCFEFACKITNVSSDQGLKSSDKITMYKNELEILKTIHHPNIIQVYDTIIFQELYILILEYCPNGSLEDKINQSPHKKLNKNDLFKYSKQLIDAVAFLHSQKIVHHDLKPSNCLIDKNGRMKLSDFGIAATYNSPESEMFKGTKAFIAPEITKGTVFDPFKADMWSLGITLYKLMTGRLPFAETESLVRLRQEQELFHAKPIDSRSYTYTLIARVINMCATPNPQNRANIFEVQKTINSIRDSQLPMIKIANRSMSPPKYVNSASEDRPNSLLCSQLRPLRGPLSRQGGVKVRGIIAQYKSDITSALKPFN